MTTTDTDAVYADVEELLFPGYLSETVVAAGVSVSVRTVFPSEYHYIRTRATNFVYPYEWKCLYVAHTVWEVDGHVVGADFGVRRGLYDLVRSWPGAVLDAVYATVSKVRDRIADASEKLEAYCYEDRSRTRWRMGNRRCPSDEGPPWVGGLGSNQIQRAWVGYNLAEDDRLRWENDWYAAKTITSSMVPKWVKQVTDRENARWQTEEERRKDVMNRARTGAVDPGVPEGMVVQRHRTNDDLVEQMKRWRRGELDDHDRVVQGYKEGIKRRHEEARVAHERRMADLERAAAEMPSDAPSLVGYTPDQLAEMGRSAPERTRRIFDASHPGRLYDRYLSTDIRIGGLRPDGKGGDIDDPRPPISDALVGRRVTMPTNDGKV